MSAAPGELSEPQIILNPEGDSFSEDIADLEGYRGLILEDAEAALQGLRRFRTGYDGAGDTTMWQRLTGSHHAGDYTFDTTTIAAVEARADKQGIPPGQRRGKEYRVLAWEVFLGRAQEYQTKLAEIALREAS